MALPLDQVVEAILVVVVFDCLEFPLLSRTSALLSARSTDLACFPYS